MFDIGCDLGIAATKPEAILAACQVLGTDLQHYPKEIDILRDDLFKCWQLHFNGDQLIRPDSRFLTRIEPGAITLKESKSSTPCICKAEATIRAFVEVCKPESRIKTTPA